MKKKLGFFIVSLLWFFCLNNGISHAKNLIPGDSSFETGAGILVNGFWGNNKFEIDKAESMDGKQSLKVWGPIGSHTMHTETGKTYTFSLHAKGEKDNINAELLLISPTFKQVVSIK